MSTKQPTGQGIWSANLGASFLKTLDLAILFANVSFTHTFRKHFADLGTRADTMTPGTVYLGNAFNYGVGIAFVLNEKTNLSMAFSQRLNGNAKIRADDATFSETIIGSDGNAATLNIGMTYALSDKMTFVSSLGIGLEPGCAGLHACCQSPVYTVGYLYTSTVRPSYCVASLLTYRLSV